MSIAERRAAFGALLSGYHNSFENVKEGAVRHSRQFIRNVLMLEAGKQALSLDPRLTSTDSGAIAVGIAKHVMTNEKAARSFIDIEIGESGAYVVSFDKDVQPDMAVSLVNSAGVSAMLCKAGDHIGEGLISDLLILAVEPTATIAESYIAAAKTRVDESAGTKYHTVAVWHSTEGSEKASHMDDLGHAERAEHIKTLVNDHHDPSHEGYADDRPEHPAKGLGSGYRHQEVQHQGSTFGMVWNPHHEIAHLYKHMPASVKEAHEEKHDVHSIKVDGLEKADVEHLHSLAAQHSGKAHPAEKNEHGEMVSKVHVPMSKTHEFSNAWNARVTTSHAVRATGAHSLGHYAIPVKESLLAEGLHADVTKSLSHAGMDGSKLYHAPGEGWSALHGALAKHGLVIHDNSFTGDHSTHHRGVYQLAKPAAKSGESPKPIEGAYLHVHRTAGVGDGEGVDGSDHPIKGKHEFNTYLPGKKLKESEIPTVTEAHAAAIHKVVFGEQKLVEGVTVEAKSVPHVKVMFSHPIEGGDINPMLGKLGKHDAVGSHHEFDHARKAWIHHFSFTGKDAQPKAEKFGKQVSDTLKVPHHVILSGEIKESASKLDAVMRAFAVPGLREKKTCKFDDIFTAAVGVVRGWPQTSYGVCAESAAQFDELVENVVIALAEHAGDEEVSRRATFEIAQTLVEEVTAEEIGTPDIFADKMSAIVRARLIECGIGHPDVSAALTEICA